MENKKDDFVSNETQMIKSKTLKCFRTTHVILSLMTQYICCFKNSNRCSVAALWVWLAATYPQLRGENWNSLFTHNVFKEASCPRPRSKRQESGRRGRINVIIISSKDQILGRLLSSECNYAARLLPQNLL